MRIKIKTTILLLVLTFLFILLLNFSSAIGSCEGNDVITECSLIDCSQYQVSMIYGYCNSGGLEVGCSTVGDGGYISPYICQNNNTQPTAQPTNNVCPDGYEATKSTQCSTFTTSSTCSSPCSWTENTTPTDTTNPSLEIIQPVIQSSTNYLETTLNFKVNDTNLNTCFYSLNNAANISIQNLKNLNQINILSFTSIDGLNTLSLTCEDKSKNSKMISIGFNIINLNSDTIQNDTILKTCSNLAPQTTKKIITNGLLTTSETKTDFCTDLTLTQYSCDINKNITSSSITCPSGCENSKCQTSTSYWANKDTNIELTSKQVVTENSPKEIKLIIKNVGSTTETKFKIYEKTNNVLITEVTGKKVGNTIVATYNFTTAILEKVKLNNNEFTFYFKSNNIDTLNPEISLLIQKEELACPTKGTKKYNNKICDNTETGLLCPLDCFTVGDGLCNEELNENIFSSFYDCGPKNGLSVSWIDKNNNVIEYTNVTKVDINEIGKISFTMIKENSNLDNLINFQLIGIKNLAEFPIKNFTGVKNKNTISYSWTPTYEDFKKLKEFGRKTKFVFIFKINNIRSSPLKIDLSSDIFPTCNDEKQNGNEEGIDCGGSCDLSCEQVNFCEENMIISCSAYTDSGENFCEENPCNLYINSNSSCYWDTNKCEKKTVGETGICYYSEKIEKLDTCEDGYLLYNYDSRFVFNDGIENKTTEDFINCVPESIPIACNLPSKKNKGSIYKVLDSLDKRSTNDKLKIAFLAIIALSFIYFSIKTFRTEKKITPQERIKKEFIKNKAENKKPKDKKNNEIKTKSKKEIDAEELMKDFEMELK